eukprot:4165392-Alexandrium_andersonii.AAC.1
MRADGNRDNTLNSSSGQNSGSGTEPFCNNWWQVNATDDDNGVGDGDDDGAKDDAGGGSGDDG